jgi:GAF domain-containing protein/CheY-like chemotaxis protein
MKIIRSHKTLFKKIFIIGFVIAATSIVTFLAYSMSALKRLETESRSEAGQYLERLNGQASAYADSIINDAASAFSGSIKDGSTSSKALAHVGLNLSRGGLDRAQIWYQGQSGEIYSYGHYGGDVPIPQEFRKFKDCGLGSGAILYQNELYTLIYRAFESRRSKGSDAGYLIMALPKAPVYGLLDEDERIVGIELCGSAAGAEDIPRPESVFSIPLITSDSTVIGLANIKKAALSSTYRNIWEWEITLLGFLPLLCIFIFGYLLVRYFESFSDHSDALCRLLRKEKPGVEIFRRDQHTVEKYMPELAELFSLAEENVVERVELKKDLELLGMTLEMIGEKGFEGRSLNEILELFLQALPGYGGAVFAFEPSDGSPTLLGKYKVNEELIHMLTNTLKGMAFLKAAQKQTSGMSLDDLLGQSADRDLADISSIYESVYAYPLRFKAQIIATLVLVSIEKESGDRFLNNLGDLSIKLMAILAYGASLEQEKRSRSKGSRILQETSGAISSTLDLPSVLTIVAHRLTDYSGATYCMILLNIDNSGDAEVASFYSKRREGVYAPDVSRINLVEFPRLADAIRAKRATILGAQDIAGLSNEEKAFFCADSIKSLTILPISHSAKFIGSIVLGEERTGARGATSGEELSFIQAIASQAASAIENARLYGTIRQKVEQLTASFNVSAAINSEIDIDSMLARVLEATGDYLDNTSSVIFMLDETRRILRPLASGGSGPVIGSDGGLPIRNDTIPGLVASTGESVIIDDIRLDSQLKSSFPETLSELAVPVKISEKVIGVFGVGSESQNNFSSRDEDFLQSLAAQIAVAMERARLFEQERKRSQRLKTIFEFSRKTSESLNLHEVLKLAVDSIQEAFGYHLVAIFLIDNEHRRFFVAQQAAAIGKEMPSDFTVDLDKGLLGRAVNARKTLYCANVKTDPNYVPAIDEVQSEVCIPIIAVDNVLGVLDVESMYADNFAAEDISILETLVDILAVAIDNSYLFKETMEKAERLGLIDKINTAISAALDLDSFFNVVAKAVADNAGYRWTLLLVPDGDTFSCKAGYSPRSLGNIYHEPVIEMLKDKLRQVFSGGRPEFVSFKELTGLGGPEKLQPVVDAGIRHLALLPIGNPDKSEAILTVGSSRTDGFTRQELSLLNDLAVHLRIAWQNTQLYEQLKTAYRQLQDAQDRMVQTEKLRALGEMSSGVVHDFNNILAAILGRVQLMIKGVDAEESHGRRQFLRKNLEVIEKAAMDGSLILSRISEFTKKKPTEKFVSLHIDQIIADVIELTKPRWYDEARAAKKNIAVEFHRSGSLLTTGSPSELREVFTNLIINAVDAIPGMGKISIDASIENESLISIVVEDNGQGMSDETKKKIFEPFFTTKGKRGTGLGLSVTYGIINRHGGKIEVESSPSRGSKFIITIPRRKDPSEESIEHQSDNRQPVRSSILIVDDEESLAEVLTEILESGDYQVDAVSSGAGALEAMSERKYDVLITDLGMNDISGWDLADAVYERYHDMKVIVATGWGAQVEPGSLSMHHVNSLISKPFKIGEILRVVGNVLKCDRDEVLVEQI